MWAIKYEMRGPLLIHKNVAGMPVLFDKREDARAYRKQMPQDVQTKIVKVKVVEA